MMYLLVKAHLFSILCTNLTFGSVANANTTDAPGTFLTTASHKRASDVEDTALEGSWSPWTALYSCSVTCGGGVKVYHRTCREARCQGSDYRERPCKTKPCPAPRHTSQDMGCGIAQGSEDDKHTILGGTVAEAHKWPWQAGLFTLKNSKTDFRCGGTIISKQFIMTAAHCVYYRKSRISVRHLVVRVGAHLRYETKRLYVRKIIVHPQYSSRSLDNDLALLMLKEELEYTKKVAPVCLPQQAPPGGQWCYATGWGVKDPQKRISSYLREVRLRVFSAAACKREYPFIYRPGMLCAGENPGRKGVHKGDSGGPLVCQTNGRFTQYGVTSFMVSDKSSPDVYTNVYYYTSWLKKTLADHKR